MFREWYHLAGLGALALVAIYFGVWWLILTRMEEAADE